ncbi:MAG TPA: cysteine-rich CWC family protein [Burkholderiaceae bacterium]
MSICEQCGKQFSCAMQDGKDDMPCWCTTLPKLTLEDMPANASAATRGCLCPDCLRKWIDSRTTS